MKSKAVEMTKYLPNGNCRFLFHSYFLISNCLSILLCKYVYCNKYCLLITYTFETRIPSQNRDCNTRSKEARNVMGTLSKIENNLMASIRDQKDEIINLKEIIILQDDNAVLANKIVKLEDKLKS